MQKTSDSSRQRRRRRELVADNKHSLKFVLSGSTAGQPHWYVGGRPPVNAVASSVVEAGFRYFSTLPFISDDPDDPVCSVFISPTFWDQLKAETTKFWHEPRTIRLVVHQPSERVADWSEPMEPESEHGIVILEPQDDEVVGIDEWHLATDGQKFGGRPTTLQRFAGAQEEWLALEADGYRHVVQFDWPKCIPGVKVVGPWPFGRGVFSLALKDPTKWLWCVQF
jgi:hypothetical protein